ncbi:hypothetical protein BDV30DRAFT_217612, partial [Aspergillus minisclerotigenes]
MGWVFTSIHSFTGTALQLHLVLRRLAYYITVNWGRGGLLEGVFVFLIVLRALI